LGELGEVTTGKAFSSTDFDNQGEYLVITNKDISDSSKSQNVVTNRINISDNETIQRYNLSGKNILVTMDGVNLGKSAIFSNSKALLAQRVGRIKSNQLEFIYQITSSNTFLSKMRMLSVGNAIKHISLKQISDYSSLVPKDTTEQQKIGTFFKNLDDTIALHQRKIEQLKLLKQAFLQKMLANQENVPELRFADFDEEWEPRKLLDVANIVGGGTPNTNNPEFWDGDIDWYSPAEIGEQSYVNNSRKKISYLGLQKSSAKILPVGTVLFTSRAGIGNTAILAKEGATNQGFQSIIPHKDKLDSYFIYSRTPELKRYGELSGAGSTFIEVSGKQMANMSLLFPNLKEQQKIGSFFKQIDNTISLHKKKLSNIKKLKKACLQSMFI
jgi:type I restriction enzyme S subunit